MISGSPNHLNTYQMSPLQQLQSMVDETYVTEDGEEYKIELKPGLSDQEIDELAGSFADKVPADIRELLRFAKGFEFHILDEITFYGGTGLEEFFPDAIEIARDGAGNGWIVDIDKEGHWNKVFFICHDPAVVVLNSMDLTEFLQQLQAYGKKPTGSHLNTIQEQTIFDIWQKTPGFIDIETARASSDETLRGFAAGLPDHYVVADLRDKPVGAGFAWGKFGPNIGNAVRHSTELIWGIEGKGKASGPGKAALADKTSPHKTDKATPTDTDEQKKKSFFSKLFGR